VRIAAGGDADGAGKPEVGDFELALPRNKKVLRLQVAVQNLLLVAEGDPQEKLEQKGLLAWTG
jgi:hypothetical protein